MINRRLIRIKILQILYSFHQSDDKTIIQSEKELFKSIDKTYELYHLILLLIVDIMRYNEDRIEIARNKKLPSQEDLSPNTRFIDNKVIEQIRVNEAMQNYVHEYKLSWSTNQDLIRNLYNELKISDFFKKYMTSSECTYKHDRSVLVLLVEKIILQSQLLNQVLEDKSIFWNDDIDHVVNMVIKTLDGFKESDPVSKPLMPLFKNEDDRDFAKLLFRKSLIHKDYFNKLIELHASNWELDRIAFMDSVIMHMAMAELMEFQSIPVKVTLNEYIEIAKSYSTEKSGLFVNGILDKTFQTMKEEGKIIKTGRGLLDK